MTKEITFWPPLCRRAVGPLLLAGALALPLALPAQLSRLGRIRNFKIAEIYEPGELGPGRTNRIKSQLTGQEAQPQLDGTVFVEGMRLESYETDGRTNLIAQAPECIVDGPRHLAYSTNRVEVATANGQFYLEGVGFLSSLTNIDIIISNRVRTVIRRDAMPLAKP